MVDLNSVAKQLVAKPKGLLAADWSAKSIGKRFEQIGVENTFENRKIYRTMLFTTQGLGDYISGVIQHEETVRQGLGQHLEKVGILPGVKVDEGLSDMPEHPGEKISDGLDGLRLKLKELKTFGVVFCKWRTVSIIGENLPSAENTEINANTQARYALLCQEEGLVPIVEPEVLIDGKHTIEKSGEVTELVIKKVFEKIAEYGVDLSGMILKTSMVISGKDCGTQATSTQIARETVKMLLKCVPAEVPGIVFLSGGQDADVATTNLGEIAKLGAEAPWPMTFSFERAIEEPALFAWGGKDENVHKAQMTLIERARTNSQAVSEFVI